MSVSLLSDMEKAIIYEASKKDADARLVQDRDTGLLLYETSINLNGALHELRPAAPPLPPPKSLIETAAEEATVDVRVRVVRCMFLANCLFLMAALLFGLPLYMWHTTLRTAIIVILVVAAGGVLPLAYLMSAWLIYYKQHNYACGALLAWWIAAVFVIGCSANLAGDAAPFQFVLILWSQCMVMLVYARLSPRFMLTTHAMFFMALATLLIWGISIAVFFYDHDWLVAGFILLASLACVPYHGYQIRAAEARYSMRQDDLMACVVQFYADPVLWLAELAH
jgi:hypothetical protein